MVEQLRWKEAYSVGVPALDEAHRAMIDRAAALVASLDASPGAADPRDILDDLIECAVDHFDEEERMLAQHDWPGLSEHMLEHGMLLRTLLKFKADQRYGRLTAVQAGEFIADWVLTHILDDDMKYRPCLAPRHAR
jgi:hemerythrin